MTITRTQLGRLLGFLLLTVIIGALSWGATAWITWQANPGDWSLPFRCVYLGFVFVLALTYWLRTNVTVVDDAAAQRR